MPGAGAGRAAAAGGGTPSSARASWFRKPLDVAEAARVSVRALPAPHLRRPPAGAESSDGTGGLRGVGAGTGVCAGGRSSAANFPSLQAGQPRDSWLPTSAL